jgi:hypothetical protein
MARSSPPTSQPTGFVTVQVQPEPYLPGEAIVLPVTISNVGSDYLRFGHSNGVPEEMFSATATASNGDKVKEASQDRLENRTGSFVLMNLEPNAHMTEMVDISKLLDLSHPESYLVVLTVSGTETADGRVISISSQPFSLTVRSSSR